MYIVYYLYHICDLDLVLNVIKSRPLLSTLSLGARRYRVFMKYCVFSLKLYDFSELKGRLTDLRLPMLWKNSYQGKAA